MKSFWVDDTDNSFVECSTFVTITGNQSVRAFGIICGVIIETEAILRILYDNHDDSCCCNGRPWKQRANVRAITKLELSLTEHTACLVGIRVSLLHYQWNSVVTQCCIYAVYSTIVNDNKHVDKLKVALLLRLLKLWISYNCSTRIFMSASFS